MVGRGLVGVVRLDGDGVSAKQRVTTDPHFGQITNTVVVNSSYVHLLHFANNILLEKCHKVTLCTMYFEENEENVTV
jgi:hypothetical protein